MVIRDFQPGDAPKLVELQSQTIKSASWPASDFEVLGAHPDGIVLVSEGGPDCELTGFAAARQLGPEAELYLLAVAPAHRRRGIAKSLLAELHRRLAARAVQTIFLEVRESNRPAIMLYHSVKYVRRGLRREYYQPEGENAIVLACRLGPDSGSR